MSEAPMQVEISSDEIAGLFQKLYPEQFNRVVAELKALKFEQLYLNATQLEEESTDGHP